MSSNAQNKPNTRKHREGSKIQATIGLFKSNLSVLPKAGPTAFRTKVLNDIQVETGATAQSAPGLYNQAKKEAIARGLIKESDLQRGTAGRGIKLREDLPWTVVLEHNNSPVSQYEDRQSALDACEKGQKARKTSTILKARAEALKAA